MKEFRTTVLLILVLVGVYGAMAIFDDHELPDLDGPQRLLNLRKEDLVEVVITRQGEDGKPETFALRRQKIPLAKGREGATATEGWIVQSGNTAYTTDPAPLDQLLKHLSEFEVKRTLESEGKSPAEFGLDKPHTRIQWSAPGAEDSRMRHGTLEIGGRSPVGSLLFTRLDEKPPVYAAESWRVNIFTKEPAHFRNRQVLDDFQAEELESIRIVQIQGQEEFTLRRRNDESWWIEGNGIFEADPAEVGALINDLRSLRTQQFLSPDPGKLEEYGLAQPRLVIKFNMRNGLTTDLKVGNVDPDRTHRVRVLAGQSPQPVTVDGDLLNRAFAPPSELRVKTILKGRFADLERFRVRYQGGAYAFAKLGGPWRLESAPQADVDAQVRDLLDELQAVSVNRFVENSRDPASFGLFSAPFQITVPGGGENGKNYVLKLSAGAEEKGYFLFQEGDPTVYRASNRSYYVKLKQLAERAEELTKEAAKAAQAAQAATPETTKPAPGAP